GTQSSNLERDELSTLLTAVMKVFDIDKRLDAAKLILDSAPVPLFENPDGAFERWVSVVDANDPSIVVDLLSDDSLNDEQKNRVLVRVSDSTLAVDSPSSIEAVLKDATRPKTRSALIERLVGIAQTCSSASTKSTLAQHL